jgi:hypothetical protein
MSKSQNKSEEASSFHNSEQPTKRLIAVPRKDTQEKLASDTSLMRQFPLTTTLIIVTVLALLMYYLIR